MSLAHTRVSRGAVFAILMVLSSLALLLPPYLTDPLKHVAQLLVPAQDLLYSASHRAARAVTQFDAPDEALSSEADLLKSELASLATALEQLRAENQRLRSLRDEHLRPGTPVLPARVVARDLAAARDSALLARGSSRGVSLNDWVSARLFLDRGRTVGVEEGQPVLAEQCLLGRVEQVSPYMARVQMFGDVDSPRIEVRVGSFENRKFKFVDYPCSLRGAGGQKMLIEGVDYRVVQTDGGEEPKDGKRRIRFGDLVFSAPGQLGLPSPMLIGRVSGLSEDPKKRLVYNISVDPIVRSEDIHDVFVIPLVQTTPVLTRE